MEVKEEGKKEFERKGMEIIKKFGGEVFKHNKNLMLLIKEEKKGKVKLVGKIINKYEGYL
jgi:predicted nucleotide-binding protein (sugar kinase/HSP70/actin superfamily)